MISDVTGVFCEKALSAPLVHELLHAGDDSGLQCSEREQAKPLASTSQQTCGPESVSECFQYYAGFFFPLGMCSDLLLKMCVVCLYFSSLQ